MSPPTHQDGEVRATLQDTVLLTFESLTPPARRKWSATHLSFCVRARPIPPNSTTCATAISALEAIDVRKSHSRTHAGPGALTWITVPRAVAKHTGPGSEMTPVAPESGAPRRCQPSTNHQTAAKRGTPPIPETTPKSPLGDFDEILRPQPCKSGVRST